jgi:hypothetical protein
MMYGCYEQLCRNLSGYPRSIYSKPSVAHLERLGWIYAGLGSPIRGPAVQTGQRTASQVQTRGSKLKDKSNEYSKQAGLKNK